MKSTSAFIAPVLFATVWLALTSPAADHTVHMTAVYAFSPSDLEVEAGDTVTWINDDDTFSHDATSTTGLWATGSVDFESSATLLFNTPGIYPYRDSVWYPSGMIGTITVNAVNVPPPPALIILPAALANGSFRFTITNLTAGKTNIIEASTNLLQWTARATNIPAGSVLNFTNAPSGYRFFRSRQIP